MGQSGSFPASIVTKPDLARCGLVAGLLWYQARAVADSYGRLAADGESLVANAMLHWALKGHANEQEVAQARDQLTAAELWHCYTVDGQIYAEYVDWDAEQTPKSALKKRGKPPCPDDPDRPELSWLQRPHRLTTPKQQPPAITPAKASRSTVMPLVSPSRVPPREVEQGPVPAGKGAAPVADQQAPIRQTREYREFEDVCRDNGMEQWLVEEPFAQLTGLVTSVYGREWPVLIEVAKEAARSASRTPGPQYGVRIIQNLPGLVKTRHDAKAHFDRIRSPDAPQGAPPSHYRAAPEADQAPPDDDDDPIALRARQQTAALRVSHGAAV